MRHMKKTTDKQRWARERNITLGQLKGMLANLDRISTLPLFDPRTQIRLDSTVTLLGKTISLFETEKLADNFTRWKAKNKT